MNYIGWLRKFLPGKLKYKLVQITASLSRVEKRSSIRNIYHCCIYKTGSQWIRRMLCDPRTYRYTGLYPFSYQKEHFSGVDPRPIKDRVFSNPFPERTIVSPLYIGYDIFEKIPKPDVYRAFFVMRDPRDLVVSSYFSLRYSHPPNPNVRERRKELRNLSRSEGLLYVIDLWESLGRFDALRSWAGQDQDDTRIRIFRFEDLTGSRGDHFVKELFAHCDICMPDRLMHSVIHDHSLVSVTGRRKGQEEETAKYRRGISGDWREKFNDKVSVYFQRKAGDLPGILGYE
ncbi:MAG: sulfotransferase domain-containing protein [Candidatus Brocadiia bacterium]